MTYKWNFAPVWDNLDVLLVGAIGTLKLFAICLCAGLVLGLFVGLARNSSSKWLYGVSTIFVEFFRNTPTLVQILWFYYALPVIVPFNVEPMLAASLGISLNAAAFSAEIFRGGIQSIEKGQWEGALAVGMTYSQTMRRVVLPQALRRMLPAFTNRGIEVFKMTTLASAIAYVELLQQGKLLASLNFNPIETYTAIAAGFFIVLFPLVQAMYALERRLARSDS